ncbi:MAG TPA: CRTAC1 family protein [Thermoanaerobaculia bacterium]|nr:CRTAC1 family protein [Thermoanaerobaculia bacterium]
MECSRKRRRFAKLARGDPDRGERFADVRPERTELGTLQPWKSFVAGAVLSFVGALLASCRSPEPQAEAPRKGLEVETASAPETAPSHRRMIEVLRAIRERTPEENHWVGDGQAKARRRELAALGADSDPLIRWRLLREVGEHELRLGNERDAIERFEEAWDLVPRLLDRISEDDIGETLLRLGVANLRYGETQNCTVRHSAEACILPLRGQGIHVDREGSENAIRYFSAVAAATPRDRPRHLEAVWLLNVAYLTVGGYPHDVPKAFLLPPHLFEAREGFPRLANIAPKLGLATFDLAGGMVVDDFTGDGHLDVFTTTSDPAEGPRLFVNQGDATFVAHTRVAGLEGLYGGLNVIHGDVDNDGDLDLFVLRGAWLEEGGRHPNSLLLNDGSGRFTDVTFDAGLALPYLPTQTAAFADYDNDGDLDLFVGNEHGGPGGVATFDAPCQLFRNEGDGTFTDVAEAARVDHRGFVKGVTWGDYDGDRYPDLYVSNLGARNLLFHNEGDGTFTEVAVQLGVESPENSFPVWFWDYDNDGALDLWVSSYRGSRGGLALVAASTLGLDVPWDLPKLYRGDGRGGFREVAAEVGLTRLALPMGANFGDLDGDGWLDFYLGTGYPDYEAQMPNVLYRNRDGREFVDITLAAGVGHLQKGHAISFADFDNDGDLDLFEQMGGAFPGDPYGDALYENPGFGHRWLTVELRGVRSNRSAIGARLRVDVLEGTRRRSIYRHVGSGGSFGGNPLRQTIGLGHAERIAELEVYWPTTDLTQRFDEVPMDVFLRVVEGEPELERVLLGQR